MFVYQTRKESQDPLGVKGNLVTDTFDLSFGFFPCIFGINEEVVSMKWLRENAAAIMAIMAILTPFLLYASSIDGRLDSIEKDVLVIKKDLSALNGDLSVLKGDLSALKGDFSALRGDLSVLKGDFSALKKDLSAIKRHIGVSSASIATSDN